MKKNQWELVSGGILRLSVPGGWFVRHDGGQTFFYPDPEHLWLK